MWGRSKLLLVTLLVVGCAPKVRFEGIESVRRYGTVGADVAVRVTNDSRRTLVVESGELTFFTASGSLGSVELRGEVEIPRRSEGVVASRWRLDAPDVASEYTLQRRLENGEWAGLDVAGRFTVRIGKMRRTISFPRTTVSEILSNFAAPCEE